MDKIVLTEQGNLAIDYTVGYCFRYYVGSKSVIKLKGYADEQFTFGNPIEITHEEFQIALKALHNVLSKDR